MVTTIKSAFDPLNDLSSLGLAGTYMIPNLSDISNKAMIAMSATSTGLNMLDKVGEHHAANPDQTLFQATYGTAKNFVKDAVTDKSFVKPREAVDHLVNVAKFGTELVTPLGLKAFTNPIESANDGVAAAFRTMAIAKSLKQAHQDTKQQTQQDSTLNYASTFKNVLPQYLKANKIGRAEALKMFGGGLKVVPGMHGGNDANLYNAGAVAMGTAASLANATIGKFAPVANFVQTGKDVVKGLEQGILKNAGIATNAIATLGDSVQSQIKQNMGISSPSKVMIALGLMITSGLAVGIKKGIVDVSGASKLLLKVFDFVTKKINLFNSQDISSYDDIIKNSADGTAQTTKNVYDEANKVNKRTFFGSLLGAGMVAIGSTGILGDKVSAPFKHLGAYYQGNIDVHKIQGRTAREAEMAVMYQSMAEFAKANKKKEWKNLWGMAQKQTEMISDDWSVTSGVVGTSVAQIPEFKTLYKTLGGFNYGQNKEGGLQINDVYDWNAGEKKATKFKTPFGVAKKVNDFLIKHPKMAEKLGFTYNPKYKGYGINTKKAPLFAFLGDPDDPTLSNGNDIILGDAIHSVIGGKAYIQSHTTSQEKLRELQKKARTAFNRVQGNPVRFAEQPEIQSYLEGLDFGDAPSYNLLNLFGVNDVLNRRTAKNNLTKEKIESFKKSGAFPYEENIKHGKGLLEEFEKDKASNPLYSVAKFANKKGLNDYLLMSMHEQAGIENKLKLQKEIFKELSGRMPVSYENPVINHKSFFDNIKQMRKDGLSYKDIGRNVISAFSEGVLTSAGSALATVIIFAKNILSAIKKVFRIASPSGEGIDVGKNFASSTGVGIDNGSDKAVESAKTLAEKLKATLREEFKSQILSEENLQINPARVLSQQMERFDGYVSGITPEEIRKKYAELQKRNISGISHDYVFKYAANDLEELLDPTNKSDATIKRDKKKADYIQKTLNNVFDKFDDWDSKWGDAFVQTDDGVKSKQEYLKSKYPYTYQKDGFIRENSFVGINDVLNRRTAKNAFLKERIEMKSEYFNTPSSIKEGQRLLRKYEKIKSRYPFYSLEKFAEEEGLYPHRLIPMHEQAKRANKPKLQKEILDYTGTYYEDVKPINPKGFFDNIKQMRKDGLGYKDIGINLISALKEGVLLSVPHVLRTINIFAKSVIATVKNIFKIASPSQVFIEIGKNIISSIGTGIKNFAPIALKATQDIAGGIFKTLLNFSKGKVFKNIGTSFFNGGVLKNLISSFFAGGALKDVGIGLISSMFKGGALKDVGIEFISSMFMGGGLPNIAIGLVSSLFAGGIFKNVAIDSIFKGGGIFKNIGVGLISSIFKGGSLQDISIQLISSFFKGGSLKDVGIGLVSAIFKSTNLQDISSNFFSSIFKGGGLQNISSNFFSSIFKDGILKNISSSFKKLLSGYAPVPDSQSTPQNPQGSITLADQYLNAGNTLVTNVFEAVKSSIRQSTLSGYASLGQVMRNAVNAALFSLSNTLKQPLHQALLSQARSILPWFLQFIPASFQLLPKLSFAMPFVGGMALRFGNSIIKNLLENNILKEGGFLTNLLSSITKINLPTLAGTKTAGVAGFLSKIVAPLPFIAGSHPLLGLGINAVSPVYDAFSGILGLDNSMKPNLKKQALSAKEVFENQTKINRKKAQLQDFK
ncbi:MAG: hypothetical protein ACK53Q_21885 [Dolichospermum sp.]